MTGGGPWTCLVSGCWADTKDPSLTVCALHAPRSSWTPRAWRQAHETVDADTRRPVVRVRATGRAATQDDRCAPGDTDTLTRWAWINARGLRTAATRERPPIVLGWDDGPQREAIEAMSQARVAPDPAARAVPGA